MKRMTSAQARQAFLDYFAGQGHQIVASSSLVPANDPTLLFTNAGMVQFKDVFLGLDERPYKRAATAQKCMRISGKHNDLESVGPSPRHQTFFEMLGNFSFGDYFKREAIRFGYECLTVVYGIPPERLYYTVYQDDDEAFGYWVDDMGVPAERVHRMGVKTNFWQMADTGPCGPTSEIHYDRGLRACTCGEPDCSVALDNGCDRWLELWNLVFMQFNRDEQGVDHPLPAPGVDTGLGLERLVSVLQKAAANYDTDLFTDIMDATQRILGHTDAQRKQNIIAYRVIADHTRAAAFLIADGVVPGTTGREYVPRMLIRRAWRFAHSMGVERPFLADVADAVIEKMGDYYLELRQFREAIRHNISNEEAQFRRTLETALNVLDDILAQMQTEGRTQMSGTEAFQLFATHGLPFEITRDLLHERGLSVDEADFECQMERHHQESGRGARGEFADVSFYQAILADLKGSSALGDQGVVYDPYDPKMRKSTHVVALISQGQRVKTAGKGSLVEVVLAETPFYVEAGGQVSDTGLIAANNWSVRVDDTRQPVGGLIVHIGEVVEGTAHEGDAVSVLVNAERRRDIMRNHTATHLLHQQLRATLGEHVRQRGSLVAPDRLRFDFSHNAMLTQEQLDEISRGVNQAILANYPVEPEHKSLEEARHEGAMALFGEKYGQTVRTITMHSSPADRFSYELCGGSHVSHTAEIGPFVIVSESSVGSGVRRIEAVTGRAAQQLIQERLRVLEQAATYLNTDAEHVGRKVLALQDQLAEAEHRIEELQRELAYIELEVLLDQVEVVRGVAVLAAVVDAPDAEVLGEMTDWYRERIESGVVVLGSTINSKVSLAAAVTRDLIERGLHAGKLIQPIAKAVGGGGGGSADFATAGGRDSSHLEEALARVAGLVEAALD
jgi:alanyl-tRNA synthetase